MARALFSSQSAREDTVSTSSHLPTLVPEEVEELGAALDGLLSQLAALIRAYSLNFLSNLNSQLSSPQEQQDRNVEGPIMALNRTADS